jgi:glycosyltransferase involved in cell wall biosynthesis
MRILHLIPSISALRGGPSLAVLCMVASLRKQGLEAAIVTTNDNGREVSHELPLGVWHDQEVLGEKVPVLAFARWSPPLRVIREFAFSPGLNCWLEEHARYWSLVHVHALFSFPTSFGMAQLRRQHVPYFLRTIGQLNRWSLKQSAVRKRMFLRVIDRANIAGATALHFTSEAERTEASVITKSVPSFVLPLGVPSPSLDLVCDTPSNPLAHGADEVIRFLFLSRLHPKKQLPLLLDSLALLLSRQPCKPWILDVAGDGDPSYIQYLSRLAFQLGLSSRIHWHGLVSGQAKQSLLAQAHWFVLPSASENFGIAAAEALMAGTPVLLCPGVAISSDVLAAGAGIICEPNVDSLSLALERCLTPPTPSMRCAARLLARERYSWPAISSSLSKHYQHVLLPHS